jgi:hypothetical protein
MSEQPNQPGDFLPALWRPPQIPDDTEADDGRAANGDSAAHTGDAGAPHTTSEGGDYPGSGGYPDGGGDRVLVDAPGEPRPRPGGLPAGTEQPDLPPPAADRHTADSHRTVPRARMAEGPAFEPLHLPTDGSRARRNGTSRDSAGAALPQSDTAQTKIGLWGSPASGKTTYLAALRHAVATSDGSCGRWTIYGRDPVSERLLVDFAHRLVQVQEFPEQTALGAKTSLQWDFEGDLAGSRYARRRPVLGRRAPRQSRFVLDLVDVSGEAFGYEPNMVPAHVVGDALEHLAQSHGLIYLFDPMTERDQRTAADYLDRTLMQLAGKIKREQGHRMVGRFLPHYVSVCVSKFDHPEMFQQARHSGLVNYGLDGIPRVPDEHAEEFFDSLCDGKFWKQRDERSYASAAYVRSQLRNYFHPARIHYFVSSSIGFWRPPGWDQAAGRPGSQFNPEDFANVRLTDGILKIRGPIYPINVIEPLVALQQRLTGRRWR